MKAVRDILVAMVNATIILAIALVVCLIILIGRVAEMRDTTLAMLSTQSARLDGLTAAVKGLEGKLGACSAAELAGARAELAALAGLAPDLSALQGLTVRGLAVEIVDVVGERLAGMVQR